MTAGLKITLRLGFIPKQKQNLINGIIKSFKSDSLKSLPKNTTLHIGTDLEDPEFTEIEQSIQNGRKSLIKFHNQDGKTLAVKPKFPPTLDPTKRREISGNLYALLKKGESLKPELDTIRTTIGDAYIEFAIKNENSCLIENKRDETDTGQPDLAKCTADWIIEPRPDITIMCNNHTTTN